MTKTVRLKVPHNQNCAYKYNPAFYFFSERISFRGSVHGVEHIGDNNDWYEFICNDPRCPGIAIVRKDAIRNWIHNELNSAQSAILPKNLEKIDTLGWECPICGRGNSPYTLTCPCGPNFETKSANTRGETKECSG